MGERQAQFIERRPSNEEYAGVGKSQENLENFENEGKGEGRAEGACLISSFSEQTTAT